MDFTVEDVGEYWLEHLPLACTAEDVALKNLKKGIAAKKQWEPITRIPTGLAHLYAQTASDMPAQATHTEPQDLHIKMHI